MGRGWKAFPAILLLLTGFAAAVQATASSGEVPGFELALDGRGQLHVLDDGRFELLDVRSVVGPSSHWTVCVGQDTIAPGTDAFLNSLALPLRERDSSLRMVFGDGGVMVEEAFEAVQATAVLTVTAVNEGNASVMVALRCALDLDAGQLATGDLGAFQCETSFSPGTFTQITGWNGSSEAFSCAMPDPPALVKVASRADAAVGSAWDYPIDASLNLTRRSGILLFWPERALGVGEYLRVRVLLSQGPSETLALSENALTVKMLAVTPLRAIEQAARLVTLEVGNSGPAADVEATVLFMLGDRPFSMRFLPLHVEWNATAVTDFEWLPASAGNYTVSVILPFFDARDPAGNMLTQKAEVLPNPYRFILKFSNGDVTGQYRTYGGTRFKVQIFVFNTGFAADSYTVAIDGLPDCWTAQLSSNHAALDPDRVSFIWLTFHPDSATPLGTYAFNIIATSNATGETRTLLEAVVITAPPPAGTNGTPVNYQNLIPGNGVVPPPGGTRPYAAPDSPNGGWFAEGDRSHTAFAALSILGVITAVMILIVAFYQASREYTFNVLRRIIKRALYGLLTGDEYRMIIFDAYRKMCAHLERYGFTREEHVTPREFARALKLALPLDTRSIRALTRLFEEARYSDHAFGAEDREAAIGSLRYIEQELDKLTTFSERASPFQRLRRRIGFGEA